MPSTLFSCLKIFWGGGIWGLLRPYTNFKIKWQLSKENIPLHGFLIKNNKNPFLDKVAGNKEMADLLSKPPKPEENSTLINLT